MLNYIILISGWQYNSPRPWKGPALAETIQSQNNLQQKLEELRRHVLPSSSTLILTHDYPDPDCIASAFGISQLLSFWGAASSVISFGGFIGRAENRAMIRFLNIHTIPFMLLELKDFERIIVVDCFPGKSNVSLSAQATVHAVIDHHRYGPVPGAPFYQDIRRDIGATSTIVTEYLNAAGCPIHPKLATALFYGLKTDTGDMGRESSQEDLACYKSLFALMDHALLAKIENPDRDVAFFKILHRASQSMIAFGSLGYIPLGSIASPDYVAEMADLFHSLAKIDTTVCCGVFKKNIFFSIRAKNRDEAGMNAEKIATALGGGGGGHGKMGAGRVPFDKAHEEELFARFLATIKETFNIVTAKGVHILEDARHKP
jgi:nanoRNase/pAp phosphatase (c-di-AMP/oligoRNAs hydrolase)